MGRTIKKYPKTLEEAVDKTLSLLSNDEKEIIRKAEDVIEFHFGLGMMIRNEFGLWAGNEELLRACKALHPDDASSIILRAIKERLQESNKKRIMVKECDEEIQGKN